MSDHNETKLSSIKWFPGIWIFMVIGIALAARVGWKCFQYPHQIKRLAADFSSISIIQPRPVLNNARTLVGIIHNTEHGVGVFMADAKTRDEQKLCEVMDYNYVAPGTALFGWSPDDKTFAFSWDRKLRLWTGDGVRPVEEIELENNVGFFAWLTPESFAWVDSGSVLHRFQFGEGHWRQSGTWMLNGSPRSLMALGTNAIAWHGGNKIQQLDFSDGQIKLLYTESNGDIGSISYSHETDEFLLTVNTNRSKVSSLFAVSRTTLDKRMVAPGKYAIREAQWVNQGRGYTYRAISGDKTIVIAKANGAVLEKTFFQSGGAESLFSDGRDASFYAFAAKTNEPPGVWKCDSEKGDADNVYPPWGNRDMRLHYQPVLTAYAPYANHAARYALVPPVNFSRQKKYPLVIGLGAYQWTPIAYAAYAQCLANSGAFVAFTGLTFGGAGDERLDRFHAHTNNVLAIYNELAANPSVDLDRVYLFAFSQSTMILDDLIKAYPERWRGIILLNPGDLPNDPNLKGVLATAGSVESASKRFMDYQIEMLKLGVPVRWNADIDSSHFERAQSTLRERTLLMADMVFDGHAARVTKPQLPLKN